ncbi:methionyl-tRNA formyltransferase [Lutispora saccharofermentans]|uniref:Methionyl-tRNA formyltransferase n=1 Tax=Lutispora saccharofermentans TaxID=3024236 RepID=A0ABT1ND20_9FIRM|nr:methionyl-tRNA formyltransferase [Lutispora saccharofermentans]MCQ1528063.1 methionyl-tRNA formyltransferase [Lutispora saccharofermentans]
MRIVFMGTPDFAVPSLKALYDKGYDICSVVAQPDRPKGRGNKLAAPPVKAAALEMGLEVHQPQKIKSPEFVKFLTDIKPDIIIVVAFGQILSKEILDIPAFGCINVHASLLPKLRGAAPINWSIINGDEATGITTMYMDIGLDTGDMLARKEVRIGKDTNAKELHDELSIVGAEVLLKTIDDILSGCSIRTKQNHEEATYAPILTKDMGKIDWSWDCKKIYDLIRGTYPWPGAFSYYDDKMFKIYASKPVDAERLNTAWGKIVEVNKDSIVISCGKGFLSISEIQFENQKRMKVEDYLRGHSIENNISIG